MPHSEFYVQRCFQNVENISVSFEHDFFSLLAKFRGWRVATLVLIAFLKTIASSVWGRGN